MTMMEKSSWVLAVMTSIVGLVGGLIGSTYQQSLAARMEETKVFDENRRSAYLEFLNTMEGYRLSEGKRGAATAAQAPDQRKRLLAEAEQLREKWEEQAGIAARRVGIFGGSAVIVAVANHWRAGSVAPCGAKPVNTDLQLFRAMREDAMPGQPRLSDADLIMITMRCTSAIE
jgi:hypothetical protein